MLGGFFMGNLWWGFECENLARQANLSGIRHQASGKRYIQIAVIRQNTLVITAIHNLSSGSRQYKKAEDNPIILHAKYLAKRGMARLSSQSMSIGPKIWCSKSQSWNRRELFAQHQPASKINTVVGIPGKITPKIPSPTNTKPSTKNTHRMITLSCRSSSYSYSMSSYSSSSDKWGLDMV